MGTDFSSYLYVTFAKSSDSNISQLSVAELNLLNFTFSTVTFMVFVSFAAEIFDFIAAVYVIFLNTILSAVKL